MKHIVVDLEMNHVSRKSEARSICPSIAFSGKRCDYRREGKKPLSRE